MKPDIWDDDAIGAVSIPARLLFLGLITQADDDGYLPGTPKWIGSKIYPYDDAVGIKDISTWIKELAEVGLICSYEVDGRSYIWLPNWKNHQSIDKRYYTPTKLPRVPAGSSPSAPREPAEATPPDRIGGDRRGEDRKKNALRKTADPNELPPDFDPQLSHIATRCLPILQRTAEARSAKPVHLLPVARAVEQHPSKDHVAVAGSVEHWLVHGNGSKRPAKDIVARFRNFLADSPDAEVQPKGSKVKDRSKYSRVEAAA